MNLDEIVDEIWRELGQCCSREHIRKVTVQAAAEFSEAKVTSYLPIFIRRATFQQLGEIEGRSPRLPDSKIR